MTHRPGRNRIAFALWLAFAAFTIYYAAPMAGRWLAEYTESDR